MPAAPVPGGTKIYCVSYAPFRGAQTPLDPTTVIPPHQIEEDLARLAKISDCVRIYSVDLGLDRVPAIAERLGLEVLLGIWISSDVKRNQEQVETAIALAARHRKAIRALIVGNEVLLRGEMRAATLAGYLRQVKSRVEVPVTYADVWEFWLKNRELAKDVDFVTVHILPYWEDIPIAAAIASDHIASIRAHVARELPGKAVMIGEAGWPSAGRMREGALPSLANQALILHELVARSRADRFDVNLIEAFDQPWKRHLEGTVGGHWGLFTDWSREAKFGWGQPVSNHPYWPWQAVLGIALAAAAFAAACAGGVGRLEHDPATLASVAAVALVSGLMIGAVAEATWLESLGLGGWLRSLALAAVAVASPIVAAASLANRPLVPAFAELIGPRSLRIAEPVARALGYISIVVAVLALESALGLSFNPRYRDFPYAALTAAVLPLTIVSLVSRARPGARATAELTMGAILVAASIKLLVEETFANWQAVWLAAIFVVLAATLARARIWRG